MDPAMCLWCEVVVATVSHSQFTIHNPQVQNFTWHLFLFLQFLFFVFFFLCGAHDAMPWEREVGNEGEKYIARCSITHGFPPSNDHSHLIQYSTFNIQHSQNRTFCCLWQIAVIVETFLRTQNLIFHFIFIFYTGGDVGVDVDVTVSVAVSICVDVYVDMIVNVDVDVAVVVALDLVVVVVVLYLSHLV